MASNRVGQKLLWASLSILTAVAVQPAFAGNHRPAAKTKGVSSAEKKATNGGFSRGTLSGPQPKQAGGAGGQSMNGNGTTPLNNGDAGNGNN
jgi:hypothetical protein